MFDVAAYHTSAAVLCEEPSIHARRATGPAVLRSPSSHSRRASKPIRSDAAGTQRVRRRLAASVAVAGRRSSLEVVTHLVLTSAPPIRRLGHDARGFPHNLRLGNTETGGAHGGRLRPLVEVYGSIVNHWIGMLACSETDSPGGAAVGLVCSIALLPFQFVPAIVALRMKQNEAARVGRYRGSWRQQT